MQHILKKVVTKVEHNNLQLWSKQLVHYTGEHAKTHKTNTPETNCNA